jgi:hypothetical protein
MQSSSSGNSLAKNISQTIPTNIPDKNLPLIPGNSSDFEFPKSRKKSFFDGPKNQQTPANRGNSSSSSTQLTLSYGKNLSDSLQKQRGPGRPKRQNSSPTFSPNHEISPRKVNNNDNRNIENLNSINFSQKKPNPGFPSQSTSSEPFKVVSTKFQGHSSKNGLTLLVIHKFGGIPDSFPRAISNLMDTVLAQGSLQSISRRLEAELFLFWDLEPYLFVVGKPDNFVRLGFNEMDCPTILPNVNGGSKNILKYPTLLMDRSSGLEWLMLARDLAAVKAPSIKRPSPPITLDNLGGHSIPSETNNGSNTSTPSQTTNPESTSETPFLPTALFKYDESEQESNAYDSPSTFEESSELDTSSTSSHVTNGSGEHSSLAPLLPSQSTDSLSTSLPIPLTNPTLSTPLRTSLPPDSFSDVAFPPCNDPTTTTQINPPSTSVTLPSSIITPPIILMRLEPVSRQEVAPEPNHTHTSIPSPSITGSSSPPLTIPLAEPSTSQPNPTLSTNLTSSTPLPIVFFAGTPALTSLAPVNNLPPTVTSPSSPQSSLSSSTSIISDSSSCQDLILTDNDFLPAQLPSIAVTAWHSTQGFCQNMPEELENLCREIESSGVEGAMHKEVSMSRYVYWSWRSTWTIVAGLPSTYVERGDLLLFNTRFNNKSPPSFENYVEPASMMDFALGDALLAKAKIEFSGGTYVPTVSPIRPKSTPAKLFHPIETIYGVDDLFLKMEIIYPALTATRAAVNDRLDYLREHCNFKISMATFLVAKPSTQIPGIIFGPAVGGYHAPLFRENASNTHTYSDLSLLSLNNITIIGFKEKNASRVARFEFSSKAFVNLKQAFEDRILEISNLAAVWAPSPTGTIQANRPALPCDREFLSQYILIGNIDVNAFKSMESIAELKTRIISCSLADGLPGADMADLSHLTSSSSRIRPSNLGLDDHPCVRTMKVIKLQAQVRVGITLGGGCRISDRVHVNAEATGYPPIYFTRQFLTDSEASLLLAAETAKTDCSFLIARRLTKRTELDDLVRRTFKNTMELILKREIFVWIATARHKWNGDTNSEESFLIAAIPMTDGGRAVGKLFPGFEGNASFCKLCIGSLELECMKEFKNMVNLPWKTSFRMTQTLEISKVDSGFSMGDVLEELNGYTSHEILGLAKCDPRSPSDRWNKWLLLVSSDGKNWEDDHRPPNWASLGWAVTVKRASSPLKETPDAKRYTSIRWDSSGRTISKTTVIPPPITSTPSESLSPIPVILQSIPRAPVGVSTGTFSLPAGKNRNPLPAKQKKNHPKKKNLPSAPPNQNPFAPLADSLLSPPILVPTPTNPPPSNLTIPLNPHPSIQYPPSKAVKQTVPRKNDLQREIDELKQLTGQDQVSAVGIALYPLVSKLHPIEAGRITSMMLEYNIEEVIGFLENPAELRQVTSEAMALLGSGPTFQSLPPDYVLNTEFQTLVDPNAMVEGDRTDDQEI